MNRVLIGITVALVWLAPSASFAESEVSFFYGLSSTDSLERGSQSDARVEDTSIGGARFTTWMKSWFGVSAGISASKLRSSTRDDFSSFTPITLTGQIGFRRPPCEEEDCAPLRIMPYAAVGGGAAITNVDSKDTQYDGAYDFRAGFELRASSTSLGFFAEYRLLGFELLSVDIMQHAVQTGVSFHF